MEVSQLVKSSGKLRPEVRIYTRKQESEKKKERKHALDQENDQEKKSFFFFLQQRTSLTKCHLPMFKNFKN